MRQKLRETTEKKGVSERQIYPNSTRAGWRKTELGYFKMIVSAYQQCMFEFNTHEEDPSLMNTFQNAKLKLLVDPIKQGFLF